MCLFDLRDCDDQTLEDTLDNKYCFLKPPWFVNYEPKFDDLGMFVYLFLNSQTHK